MHSFDTPKAATICSFIYVCNTLGRTNLGRRLDEAGVNEKRPSRRRVGGFKDEDVSMRDAEGIRENEIFNHCEIGNIIVVVFIL